VVNQDARRCGIASAMVSVWRNLGADEQVQPCGFGNPPCATTDGALGAQNWVTAMNGFMDQYFPKP